jgi:hypothetical protein
VVFLDFPAASFAALAAPPISVTFLGCQELAGEIVMMHVPGSRFSFLRTILLQNELNRSKLLILFEEFLWRI